MSNDKKIAFITGGNRGIGFETAKELGAQGYLVVLGVRELAKGAEAVAALQKSGIEADAVRYDAAQPETDRSVLEHLTSRYGKLDALVNNAGMIKSDLLRNTVLDEPLADLEQTFDVNLFAVIRLTRALLPLLKKAPAGRIVNVSSVLGSLTVHSAPNSPIGPAKAFGYNASKTALNAFTVHLADVLKDTPIKVNSIHPGWVKTELGGQHATDEVAGSGKTSARLATLAASGPTGGFFHLDSTLPW